MPIKKYATHNLRWDDSGKLSHLFISPDSAVAIANGNFANDVYLLDLTYKNNKFWMPLLHIMVVTATNQSFSLAYWFMAAETENVICERLCDWEILYKCWSDPMIWCLWRIERLYLYTQSTHFSAAYNLLCIWHINKNVLANLKKQFVTSKGWEDFKGDWYRLCNAVTQPDFDDECQAMKAKHLFVISSYLDNTWLTNKEKFVTAWTRHIPH